MEKKKYNETRERYTVLDAKFKEAKTANSTKTTELENQIIELKEKLDTQVDSQESLKEQIFQADLARQQNDKNTILLKEFTDKNNELLHKAEDLEYKIS